MFRQSDEPERVLHPSYSRQPSSVGMQLVMDNSRFEHRPSRRTDGPPPPSQHHPVPHAVPTTYDYRVDPNHPDADYNGLVSSKSSTLYSKRHVQEHASLRSNISQTEKGLMGADDFVLPRKRRDVAYNPVTGQVNHVFRRDGGGWLRGHTRSPPPPLPSSPCLTTRPHTTIITSANSTSSKNRSVR